MEPDHWDHSHEHVRKVEGFTRIWWKQWISQAFPLLAPRRKWTQTQRNLVVGDIVLIKSENKYGKPEFRLGKVEKLMPDCQGAVRSVMVSTRDRRRARGEPPTKCRAGRIETELAIQRLAVILPANEAWDKGVTQDKELLPEAGVVVAVDGDETGV